MATRKVAARKRVGLAHRSQRVKSWRFRPAARIESKKLLRRLIGTFSKYPTILTRRADAERLCCPTLLNERRQLSKLRYDQIAALVSRCLGGRSRTPCKIVP
jgi:hypothetical protein